MNTARLAIAAFAVSLSLNAAEASDPENTSSIAQSETVEIALGASIGNPNKKSGLEDSTASVVLPKVSVTAAPTRTLKSLPPLEPLPKWDPRVCVGC
ncbi:hypothetical protein [Methylocystis echinoides]|uniref:Uncharacterized protein n=1 Tax=Methylocystis echinoides TaxID=29468 RepID=A0A9W6LUT5_9HYPH|nr:hypothetical protein [Methylocystis echinoides]GLI96155.1 hypothetical protein LMG27198_51480 [Methylocystis echinoides]